MEVWQGTTGGGVQMEALQIKIVYKASEEITARKAYQALILTTTSVIDSAIAWAINTANDDNIGYSQQSNLRWESSYYGCSSFVITAFRSVEISVGSATYTGNMKSQFTQNGFTWIPWSQIGGVTNLQRGDILLSETNHTELYIGNNQMVGAHSSKYAKADQISVVAYSNASN